MDQIERLRALADVLPLIEAADADFGHSEVSPFRDGVHSLGWFEPRPVSESRQRGVAKGDWIQFVFEWSASADPTITT